MSSSPSPRLIASAAAIAAMGMEAALAWSGRVDDWIALPLAIATGATVIWAALALDALVRRGARPDRADILAVIELQTANRALLAEQATQIARTEELLALIASEPALADTDGTLRDAAAAVERWDALSVTLPRWTDARNRWSAILDGIAPGLAPDPSPVTYDEARLARERLPMTQNFSSQDLKAAAEYLIRADRVAASRLSLNEYRLALFARATAHYQRV